ncbi:MAG: translation initiation factor IF-6 [Thermoplasmatota archaeon]
MAIRTCNLNGNPFIGVFCRLMGNIVICPIETGDEIIELIREVLGAEVHRTSAGSTNLHGSLVAANSKGLIAPFFYSEEELAKPPVDGRDGNFLEGVRIVISDDPLTAWGNNVLLSETKALINPDIPKGSIKVLEDTFDVEVVRGAISGIKTVGSIAVLNSKGMVVHPKASPDDMQLLEEVFGVKPYISTANFGSPHLGASMIANDRGALVGSKSSGVELNRIENSLDIID